MIKYIGIIDENVVLIFLAITQDSSKHISEQRSAARKAQMLERLDFPISTNRCRYLPTQLPDKPAIQVSLT